MKAHDRGHICGSRNGRPLHIVELDKEAYDFLLDRTKRGVAMDWILIGKRDGFSVALAAVGVAEPQRLVDEVKAAEVYNRKVRAI